MPNGQFPAVIQLSSLDGRNGFKINGEKAGDESGIDLARAGDVNRDGYNDILINARPASPGIAWRFKAGGPKLRCIWWIPGWPKWHVKFNQPAWS